MNRRSLLFFGLLLSLACTEKEPVSAPSPAVEVQLLSVTPTSASFSLSSIGAAQIRYGLVPEGELSRMDASLPCPGTISRNLSLEIADLLPDKDYSFSAQGVSEEGKAGDIETLSFRTASGSSLPHPADMTLIPGPSSHRTPLLWSKDRWSKHVLYTDEQGKEHWFFDSFLLIEGQQNGAYGGPIITYSVTDDDRPSAKKDDWQQLLDFWFKGGDFLWQENYWSNGSQLYSGGRRYTGRTETIHADGGQLDALEACIAEAAARIGEPPMRRYIVMSVPEPIYYDNYIRGVSGGAASTVYWGSLSGKELDFSKVEDRISACRWYMDETRKAFRLKQYKYLELVGFYVLPEVLSTSWRAEYKQYDILIPALSEYAHEGNQWLYWIPYCMAEGYRQWRAFGIDLAYMQPNYYWDAELKPMADTFREINQYSMGLELEFEYSMVENVQGAASARLYRERFDAYLDWAKSSGVYGKRSIALYSGTDAMEQLADSPLEGDRATYHKLGHFIIESPLKAK